MIENSIKRILAEHLFVDEGDVKMSSFLVKDLLMDDLDHVEISIVLEDEFNIRFEDDSEERWVTVRDIYNEVKNATIR